MTSAYTIILHLLDVDVRTVFGGGEGDVAAVVFAEAVGGGGEGAGAGLEGEGLLAHCGLVGGKWVVIGFWRVWEG